MDFTFPVIGSTRISSGFGGRSSPGGIGSTNHKGIDIAAPYGSPVVAPTRMQIVSAGMTNGGYGNLITARGDDGNTYLFGHLSRVNVTPGMNMEAGQVIGAVGSTGNSTGNHLHFGVQNAAGKFVNPSALLDNAKKAATGALARGLEAVKGGLRGAAETVPGGSVLLGASDALGLTGECSIICQLQNWLKETGFFQRLAMAFLAFIIIFAAFYLMKGNASTIIKPVKEAAT